MGRVNFVYPPGFTFSRGSSAYDSKGRLFLPNQLRMESSIYGGTMGWVEEATTNLLTENQAAIETDTTGFNAFNGGTLSRITSEYYSGTACMKVVTAGSIGNEGFYTSPTTVAASKAYTASVWMKGSGTVKLGLQEKTSGMVYVGETGLSITLTSTWKRYSVSRTFGSAGERAHVMVYTDSTVQALTIFVDCLQLEQKAFATSWTLPSTPRSTETLSMPTIGLNPDLGTVEGIVEINDGIKYSPNSARIFNITFTAPASMSMLLYTSSSGPNFYLNTYADNAAYVYTSIPHSSVPNGIYYYKVFWQGANITVEFWDLFARTKTASSTLTNRNVTSSFGAFTLGSNDVAVRYGNTRFGRHRLSNVSRTADPDFNNLMPLDSNTTAIYDPDDIEFRNGGIVSL